jgi:hypothetical protein
MSIFIFFSIEVFSQNAEKSLFKHSLGLNVGSTSGVGISYKYQPTRFWAQITGTPFFLPENEKFLSVGLTLLYKVKTSKVLDLITYLGNSYTHNSAGNFNQFSMGPNIFFSFSDNNFETGYNIGVGGGVVFHPWRDVLDINIQGGYGVMGVDHNPRSFFTTEV